MEYDSLGSAPSAPWRSCRFTLRLQSHHVGQQHRGPSGLFYLISWDWSCVCEVADWRGVLPGVRHPRGDVGGLVEWISPLMTAPLPPVLSPPGPCSCPLPPATPHCSVEGTARLSHSPWKQLRASGSLSAFVCSTLYTRPSKVARGQGMNMEL